MDELKKVFDAARAINGHTIKQAGNSMGNDGYSITTLDQFFKGEYDYPSKVDKAVRKYIYDAGLVKSVRNLGLDPYATKGELVNATK